MATLGRCRTCVQPVSSEAKVCPHCGQPMPHTDLTIRGLFDGQVAELTPFVAKIKISTGHIGLLHISEVADHRVDSLSEILKVGSKIKVTVIEILPDGRIKPSMRNQYITR